MERRKDQQMSQVKGPKYNFWNEPTKNTPDVSSGIYPKKIVLKNKMGHNESVEALSHRWLLNIQFLPFLQCDNYVEKGNEKNRSSELLEGVCGGEIENERVVPVGCASVDDGNPSKSSSSMVTYEVVELINEDLLILLQLSHHLFWSQVVYDTSFHSLLNTFLRYFKKPKKVSDLPDSYRSILKNMLLVMMRLSMPIESDENGFGSPDAHADLVYQVLDLPRLLDFICIYESIDLEITKRISSRLFVIQNRYLMDMNKALELTNGLLIEMAMQIDQSLKRLLDECSRVERKKKEEVMESIDGGGGQRYDDIINLFDDNILYLYDIFLTLNRTLKVVPEMFGCLFALELLEHSIFAYRVLLPNLMLPIEGSDSVEYLEKFNMVRCEIMSFICNLFDILVLKKLEDVEKSGDRDANDDISLKWIEMVIGMMMRESRGYMVNPSWNGDQSGIMFFDDSGGMVEEKMNDENRRATSHFCRLNEECSSTLLEVSIEFDCFLLDLERNSHCVYRFLSLMGRIWRDWKSMKNNHFEEMDQCLDLVDMNLSKISEILSLVSDEGMDSDVRDMHEMKVEWEEEEECLDETKSFKKNWCRACKASSGLIKDIFPYLSHGYLAFALVYYQYDRKRMIFDWLDHRFPNEIQMIPRNISLEQAEYRASKWWYSSRQSKGSTKCVGSLKDNTTIDRYQFGHLPTTIELDDHLRNVQKKGQSGHFSNWSDDLPNTLANITIQLQSEQVDPDDGHIIRSNDNQILNNEKQNPLLMENKNRCLNNVDLKWSRRIYDDDPDDGCEEIQCSKTIDLDAVDVIEDGMVPIKPKSNLHGSIDRKKISGQCPSSSSKKERTIQNDRHVPPSSKQKNPKTMRKVV